MTAYEIVNFIDELPQKGVVVIETDEHLINFVAAKTTAEAVSESIVKLKGVIGFSPLTMAESSMLLETHKIENIRHVLETHL